VLDVLLDREPFAATAAELLSRTEAGEIDGCLCATTITTIHYLATKTVGAKQALLAIRKLLAIFEIAPVNRPVLAAALESGLADFEDAVLHEAACQASAQAIVTRNPSDFKRAVLPTYSPEELCRTLDLRTLKNSQG
jgi:predicted nucleic acid-binding protein